MSPGAEAPPQSQETRHVLSARRRPRAGPAPHPGGCEECLKAGLPLGPPAPLPDVRARRLLRQLAQRHATKHFHNTDHPVIASFEPGERWAWCYADQEQLPIPAVAEPYLRD